MDTCVWIVDAFHALGSWLGFAFITQRAVVDAVIDPFYSEQYYLFLMTQHTIEIISIIE